MKRYITRVIVLLLAGMLVSCGGGDGGDSPGDGGSPSPSNSANPANDVGATPPANDGGGTPPANDSGTTPPTNDGGTTPPANDGGGTPPASDGGGSTGPLPAAGARVEESDAAVILSAGWTNSDSRWGWSGGGAKQSTVAGATASITFTGTSVTWIGRRNRGSGIALVRVDAGPAIEVDLFARPNEIRTNILTVNGLSDGQHTLTIEVTGRQNALADSNVVVVDAFEVEPQIVSHLQEMDPDVILSGAGWIQDSSSAWSGGGVATSDDPMWGGMRFNETAGEKATLKFRGTSIRWSGYRGPDAGIARVQLDGGVATDVDLYSPKQKFQEVVFTATGLADTTHTLTIEVTGLKNDLSSGTRIVVDAFDVTTPGRRYQEGDPAITYTGEWNERNVNRSWSEGAAATTSTLGARATFSFTGTSVSWIACEKRNIGRAWVYIDGAFVKEVNMKRLEPIEGFQRTVFRADGLTNGPHTLTVEPVGGGTIVVDAFDVHP